MTENSHDARVNLTKNSNQVVDVYFMLCPMVEVCLLLEFLSRKSPGGDSIERYNCTMVRCIVPVQLYVAFTCSQHLTQHHLTYLLVISSSNYTLGSSYHLFTSEINYMLYN